MSRCTCPPDIDGECSHCRNRAAGAEDRAAERADHLADARAAHEWAAKG